MNPIRTFFIALLLTSASSWSAAGPGAHGPNGEHLDAPKPTGSGAAVDPRLETKTELFELVATLAGGELSLLIDRFETNEPLLNAVVEVESGGLKAKARFHADHGDYAIDDEAMLKLLGKPGAHALVITVLAGKESDLMDGTLNVTEVSAADGPAHDAARAQGWGARAEWIVGGLLALGLWTAFLLRRRSGGNFKSKKFNGEQS